ncbi:prepilin-type N-terminal cleavage/methylation domain-containing protein, partial [bacterium]
MKATRKGSRRCQGLTLVEILVVVAIIAILAGLLFPVFARAKVKAIQTACSSNLRQTSVALNLYLEDNGGRYPTALNLAGKVTPAIGPITPYAGKSPTGILHCPLDRPEGRPSRRSEADRVEPLSYHFTWGLWGGKSGEEGWDRLLEVDPNPMVVRCYFHDDRMRQLMMADPTTEQFHFIGKDIITFHTLFWPAMLKFSGRKVPNAVFVHGFLTINNGEKMSKSRGTGLDPLKYLSLGMNPEWLRYYLAAKLTARNEDVDFTPDDFLARVN